MHSPSALTEHVSPNLAGFFLLDPVHGPIGAPDLGFSVDIEKKRYIHTPLGPLLTLIYIARGKGEERKVSVSSPSSIRGISFRQYKIPFRVPGYINTQGDAPLGDGEPGITYLGITESGIAESGITWVMGIKHIRNWYNGISYNMEVECGITESGITESGITKKLHSGIRHNNKLESVITESGITESDIT